MFQNINSWSNFNWNSFSFHKLLHFSVSSWQPFDKILKSQHSTIALSDHRMLYINHFLLFSSAWLIFSYGVLLLNISHFPMSALSASQANLSFMIRIFCKKKPDTTYYFWVQCHLSSFVSNDKASGKKLSWIARYPSILSIPCDETQ